MRGRHTAVHWCSNTTEQVHTIIPLAEPDKAPCTLTLLVWTPLAKLQIRMVNKTPEEPVEFYSLGWSFVETEIRVFNMLEVRRTKTLIISAH